MSWEMRLGDSLSGMRAMDSSSIDVIIADPPYDKKTHEGMRNSDGVVQLGFEALSTMAHVREQLRVARRWVINFCALEQLGEYQLFAGKNWVRAGIWVRTNSMPQQSGDRPGQGAEGIAIMYAGNGRMMWNGGGRPAVWTGPRTNCDNHPTEKPEWLMTQLVRDFTEYGETILDTHAGSGTTGVAAIRSGRNFVGYEMLTEHHKTAISRLSGTHEQPELVFKKRRKQKQIKLFGGSNGKEVDGVSEVEEGGSVSGDLLDPGSGQASVAGAGEGGKDVDGGAVQGVAGEFGQVDESPLEGNPEVDGEAEEFGAAPDGEAGW